jgi:hypothetical protein
MHFAVKNPLSSSDGGFDSSDLNKDGWQLLGFWGRKIVTLFGCEQIF